MSTITPAEVEALCVTLTAAGDQWQEAAAQMVETGDVLPGDQAMRDRVALLPQVRNGKAVHASTLYRNESTGQWWATGWSDASKAQVRRPFDLTYDPDAGVHIPTQDSAP